MVAGSGRPKRTSPRPLGDPLATYGVAVRKIFTSHFALASPVHRALTGIVSADTPALDAGLGSARSGERVGRARPFARPVRPRGRWPPPVRPGRVPPEGVAPNVSASQPPPGTHPGSDGSVRLFRPWGPPLSRVSNVSAVRRFVARAVRSAPRGDTIRKFARNTESFLPDLG